MSARADSSDVKIDINDEAIDISAENESSRVFMEKCGKVLPIVFFALGLITFVCWIIGFVVSDEQEVLVWIIILSSIICGVLGTWAVLKYGVIQDQIDKLKYENSKYKHEIDELQATSDKLTGRVNDLQNQVKDLKGDAKVIEEQTKEFDGLITELKKVAGGNEDILRVIDDTNNIFDDMRETMLENEKAHLLSTYYETAFRDSDNKMNKNEYRRFLARLSLQQRAKFEAQGTFEELAGNDGMLDLNEFQRVLEKVLQNVDEMLKTQFSGHHH